MTIRMRAAVPASRRSRCHRERGFSTSTVRVTTLSRYTRESRYTISFSTLTGSLMGFVSREWVSTPADIEASDLAYLFSSTEAVSRVPPAPR